MKLTFSARQGPSPEAATVWSAGKEDSGGLRLAAGLGRAGQPGAGLCRRVHRRVVVTHAHIDHSAASPAGEAGLHRQHLLHPPDGQLHSIMLRGLRPTSRRATPSGRTRRASGSGRSQWNPLHRSRRGGGGQAHRHLRVRHHPPDRRRGEGALRGRSRHLLGSASVEMWLSPEGTTPARCLFRRHRQPDQGPIIRDPQYIRDARLRAHGEHPRTGSTTWTKTRTTPPIRPPSSTRPWAMGAT